jgi:hypothetical protein
MGKQANSVQRLSRNINEPERGTLIFLSVGARKIFLSHLKALLLEGLAVWILV